jgi:methyl-accepting chemotaxis protein
VGVFDDSHEGVQTDGGTVAGAQGVGGPLTYHAILDHIDTPIFVIDADGDITHWNRSLEGLTGESQAGAVGLAEKHVSR